MCFYPPVFPNRCSSCLDCQLPPRPLGFFFCLSSDSGILHLGRLLCFSTMSTTGLWYTAEACLPSAPDPEAGGLPRENGESSSVGMFMAVPGSLSSAWRCFFLVAWSLFSWLWLRVKIYLVALFFARSEEKPWERIILSWDDASSRQFEKGNGQHVGYWTSITQKKAYPCFSYFLSFTAFIEVGGRAYTVWSSSSFSAPPTSY